MNFDNLVKITKKEVVKEIIDISKPTNTQCEHCIQGKEIRNKLKLKEYSNTKPLYIVHTNLCGPKIAKGLNEKYYFMLLVDDYIRMTTVCFL
jgi:hypothetical protein